MVNYYPLILKQMGLGPHVLTLKDFHIKLSPQLIHHAGNLSELLDIVGNRWKKDINPENLLQFIPNIKIIQPYATPVMRILHIISQYLQRKDNQKKIRNLTKNINNGINLMTGLIKTGATHVWDLFS